MTRVLALLLVAAACAAGIFGVRAGAAEKTREVTIRVGDVVRVAGAGVGCKAIARDGVRTLDCRRAGPLPGTLDALVNSHRVIVARFETPTTARIIFSAEHASRVVTRCR
jgi:hypothetical protein